MRMRNVASKMVVAIVCLAAVVAQVPSAARADDVVTYQALHKLVKDKTDEAEILKKVGESPTIFTLSDKQEAELTALGATDTVIAAIRAKQKQLEISPATEISDLAIILDTSGSMSEKAGDGTKMEAARPVVAKLVEGLPHGMKVAFVIYGHDKELGCDAVKVVRSLSILTGSDKESLIASINELQPIGGTPITLALRIAGKELAKGNGPSGMVLITDGIDTCPKHGMPEDEAAKLASDSDLNLLKGVSVVGFGLKDTEKAAVEKIATAGKGTWYDAESSEQLASAMDSIVEENVKLKPAPKVVSNRRAIKVLKPEIEFPQYLEIQVMKRGLGSVAVVAKGKYGEEIRIPSSTDKYDIEWVPKTGIPVAMLKDFTFAERKVIEIKPEELLGMIQVNGEGTPPEKGIVVFQRGLGSIIVLQESKKFGEIMVVPIGKVDISVGDDLLEEGLMVEAGTLQEIE